MSDSLTKVSLEQFVVICKDLEKLLKTEQKKGEKLGVYALRLAKRATDSSVVNDDDWETLEEQTQQWVNGMIDADEKGTALILPPAEAEAEADDADVGEQSTAEAAKPAEKKSSKANGAGKKEAKAPASVKKAVASKKAAADKKPAAGKKEAKAADKKEGAARRGRRPKHGEDAVIKLTVQDNPHRKGSNDFDKFKKLKNYDGKTFGKAIAAGVDPSYLRYLEKREILTVKA